jgi:glycosyltransferase involved in cell wall biosynthesis
VIASRSAASLLDRYLRRCLKTGDALVVPSSKGADFARRHYPFAAGKVHMIPYGLDGEFLAAAQRGNPPRRAESLLFAGQYLPYKGTRVLERALPGLARRFPRLRVTFVVPREAVGRVEDRFRVAFGDRLDVLGWCTRSELIEHYLTHQVFLFPSLFEGFGKTALEAMACGMCVVGFGEGCLPDVATPGKEALILEPGDEVGFVDRIERCLRDPALVSTIGDAARTAALAHTWSRNAAETAALCGRLLRRKAGSSKVSG